MSKIINVTKPFLPPRSEYVKIIDRIWQNEWLTNDGPVLKEFEQGLKTFFGTEELLVVANGTLGLQLAFKALGLQHGDEIITTPFSYVATTSSIVWEGLVPVFVDIDRNTFNIDPQRIEASVTDKTKAILATHVFGNACDIEEIQHIADKYGLLVIYDAAHCFGVQYRGKSLLTYGDVSVLSLHATKLFHSIEGGAIVTRHPELVKRAKYYRNFGHDGYYKFNGVGINAKSSEFHAAMGLVNLQFSEEILSRRKAQWLYYFQALQMEGYKFQQINEECEYNYSYFPVVLDTEQALLQMIGLLENDGIYCRRYFYPPLSDLDYVDCGALSEAEYISSRILCLPLFHEMEQEIQDRVLKILVK